jgi:hypothetical protein
MKTTKKPFFARYLENQQLDEVVGGSIAKTTKYPSDTDEYQTMKYPSDDDETVTLKYPSDGDDDVVVSTT